MNIRLVNLDDAKSLSEYYCENRDHFKPWEPTRPFGYHSIESWHSRVREHISNQNLKQAAFFIAIDEENKKILAHCTLSHIVHGAFMACYIGFGVSQVEQGQGTMYKTCQCAIDHAFNTLNLHRIMANYMPHNNRSAKLLNRLGFVREGLAKNYLKINGKWENHILTSLTNDKLTEQ